MDSAGSASSGFKDNSCKMERTEELHKAIFPGNGDPVEDFKLFISILDEVAIKEDSLRDMLDARLGNRSETALHK